MEGSLNRSQTLLEESLTIAKDINAQDVLARAHWALGQLYEVNRNYCDAIDHQREAVILYKSLGLPLHEEVSRHLFSLRKRLGLL
jgi:hypothetical protein